MPRKIREMTEKEFRMYVNEKKVLHEGDPLNQMLEMDYAVRDADDQMDFILYSMKIKYPGLSDLSLDDMKKILEEDKYGTKDLWDNTRFFLNASDIRLYSGQLALALFGDYLLEDQKKLGNEVIYNRIDAEDVDNSYIVVLDVLEKAKKKEYINPVQISAQGDVVFYQEEQQVVAPENVPFYVPSGSGVNSGNIDSNKKESTKKESAKKESAKKESKKKKTKKKSDYVEDFDEIDFDELAEDDDKVTSTFAYEVVTDPVTGLVKFNGEPQPIGEVLTEDIMNTGNLELLESFNRKNRSKLSPREKEYLDIKISSAKEFKKCEEEALHNIAWGNPPGNEQTFPKVRKKNGFIGFSTLTFKEKKQTSDNGCWSCAYELLLESRGVFVNQEEIRAFRPDYTEDTPKNQKLNKDAGIRMNSDAVNNIYENGDLLHKLVPNSAMSQVVINSMADTELFLQTEQGNNPMTQEQKEIFKEYYINKITEQLKETVLNAITKDRSPVAINWNNHYVTITGIKPDGTIRVEDSARSNGGNPTKILSLKDVVEESLYGKQKENGYIRATGLSLCWIKDIKPVQYEKRKEEKPILFPEEQDLVIVDDEGNVTVDVPLDHKKYSAVGKSSDGQLSGVGISESLKFDQGEVEKLLGGKVGNYEPGVLYIGNHDNYFPKKIKYQHDPELIKYAIYKEEHNINRLWRTLGGRNVSLEGLSTYVDLLSNLYLLGMKGKNEKSYEKTIEGLRGLHDFLRKKTDDGRTYYQVIEEDIDELDRPDFRKNIAQFDKTLGLDLKIEELQTETEGVRRFIAGQEAMDKTPLTGFNGYLHKRWLDIKDLGENADRKSYVTRVAVILAAEERWNEIIELLQPGEDMPPTYEQDGQIRARAAEIMQSKAFQILMSKGHYKTLAESGDVYRIVNEYLDIKRRLDVMENDNLDDYAISKDSFDGDKGRNLKDIMKELRNTGTGSYDGLGIISRKENSVQYDRALESLKNYVVEKDDVGGVKGSDVYMAIEDIKEYLDGKEVIRNRSFGKKRWNLFMSALCEMMPRKDFEEYCDHINSLRGVENKPNSSDYVAPENFYRKSGTLGSVLNETMDRINNGKATKRDYARILALGEKGGYLEDGEYKFKTDMSNYGRTDLRISTERKLRSQDFIIFMDLVDPETLKNMINEKPYGAGLNDYTDFVRAKENELEQQIVTMENASPWGLTNILDNSMVDTAAAMRTLQTHGNAAKIKNDAYPGIYRCMAQMVVDSMLQEEASRPEEANKPMTAKLKAHPERLDESVNGILQSEDFVNALKAMNLDKLNPTKIKTFLLGNKAEELTKEFNKQVALSANVKKESKKSTNREVKKDVNNTGVKIQK